ncbi:hypothetical protein SNE40_010618 [Patella caerulea]|uniref:C2H2-type domain-containing protein n=1 Tax=Patella caerulea TaxID=87958 RepID=A0AAN8JUU7_PATCE
MESTELVENMAINSSSDNIMDSSIQSPAHNYFYVTNAVDLNDISNNTVTLNSKHLQLNSGAPLLVLANTDKGTMEANVLLDSNVSPYFKVDLQAIAHANLIAQTQEMLALQLSQDSIDVQKKRTKSNCKIYKCNFESCGKMFSSQNYLNLHEASHTASKSLVCDFKGCGRKFLWPAHLNYHRLTHTNNRQFMCNIEGCSKKFYTRQRLMIHTMTHTGEKPFTCSEKGCTKSFTTAGNLRNHKRIHTGERPFVCEHEGCGRRFTECSSLKKHRLVHSGEKPFTCDICGKSFSQSGTRKVHMKSHQVPPRNRVLKISEIKLELNNSAEPPDVLVLQQSSEDLTQFHGLTDHIVTITTHQPDGEQNPNEVPHHVLGAEEVLSGGDIKTDQLACDTKPNVVVLSQPQEIVNLASSYHQGHEASQEEIVYDNDLLHSHLDHEEIHGSNTSLCLDQSSAGLNVSESIISSQSVGVINTQYNSQESLSGSAETGKEMAMDPMMESDDEADTDVKHV